MVVSIATVVLAIATVVLVVVAYAQLKKIEKASAPLS